MASLEQVLRSMRAKRFESLHFLLSNIDGQSYLITGIDNNKHNILISRTTRWSSKNYQRLLEQANHSAARVEFAETDISCKLNQLDHADALFLLRMYFPYAVSKSVRLESIKKLYLFMLLNYPSCNLLCEHSLVMPNDVRVVIPGMSTNYFVHIYSKGEVLCLAQNGLPSDCSIPLEKLAQGMINGREYFVCERGQVIHLAGIRAMLGKKL